MSDLAVASQIAGGALAGGLMTGLYFALLRRQVRSLAGGRTPLALLGAGYLLRMLIFAGAMVLLLRWHFRAGIAYAAVFVVARAWTIKRYAASQKQDGPPRT